MNEPVEFKITLNGSQSITVGTSAIVYTDAFQFGDVDYFALVYKVACTGTPNIKIQMEQGINLPTNPNAADDNFGVPKTFGNIETSLTSKTIQLMQLNPITVRYVRFKITEQTGIVTDTVVTMSFSLQKKFTM
jgi:hypothetical protein